LIPEAETEKKSEPVEGSVGSFFGVDCASKSFPFGVLTCLVGSLYPPLVKSTLAAYDPIDLGGKWSKNIPINVPSCPSTLSVGYDLGSLKGLSSFEFLGLMLKKEETECIETLLWICVKKSFKLVWTETVILQSIETESKASLKGNTACLGEIIETQLSGTTSLTGTEMALELHAEGTITYHSVPQKFSINKLTFETIDLEEGTLNLGISFSSWGNDLFDFETSFENFIPEAMNLYVNNVIKNTLNSGVSSTLPILYLNDMFEISS